MRDPYGSERIRDASGEVVCVHRHVHSCWPVQPRRSISLWSAAARRGAARRDPHGASVRLHIASATSLQYIHDSHHDAAGLFLAAALLGLALGRLHPAVLQILALRKQVGLGGEERERARAASQQASTRPLSGKHCGLAPWLLPPVPSAQRAARLAPPSMTPSSCCPAPLLTLLTYYVQPWPPRPKP